MILSNMVKKEKLREVQKETLEVISESLKNSFGPMGSNTIIQKQGAFTQYSKDGYTILKNIVFVNAIEAGVKLDLEDITRHIVKNVGDGTTSAVLLSNAIFKSFFELETHIPPYKLISDFKVAVDDIKEEILKSKQEFDSQAAYNITYTSTNGNKEVATNIKNIYDKFGNDVFIDVAVSNTTDSFIKEYDGMTLPSGYSDNAYINDSKKGVCSLRRPEVYSFIDPIDTPEMAMFLDTILAKNIMNAYSKEAELSTPPVPTVILAPKISRDLSSYITSLVEFMYKFDDESQKPPLLIITNIHQPAQFSDIARMCGCKPIKKYIDHTIQESEQKNGLAPTVETIFNFAGTADIVEADLVKTKFVNPMKMHDANGELSTDFNSLVKFLESELKVAYEENQDANVTGNLKRRINSLKANMVEYLVGGISVSDRDSLRDLVEDSVLNCRSAALHGWGKGGNLEALLATDKLCSKSTTHSLIYKAYIDLYKTLLETSFGSREDYINDIILKSIKNKELFNIRTGEFDKNDEVICSINTDIVILDGIAKVLTLLLTSNQFFTYTPADNTYLIDRK